MRELGNSLSLVAISGNVFWYHQILSREKQKYKNPERLNSSKITLD
jgi:hypothetical protein